MAYEGNIEKQVTASHYAEEGFSPLRIDSVMHQIREIALSGYENILEVGVGGNIVKHFLSSFPDIKHTSIDIAEDLNPDYIGSVTDMPFEDKMFDLTLCCQVLEHLPFDYFDMALKELKRVTKHIVILSLPDQRKRLGFSLCLPKIQWKKWEYNYRFMPSKNKDRNHKWEIGIKGSSGREVEKRIKGAGFKIKYKYRLEKHSWHCFFILQS